MKNGQGELILMSSFFSKYIFVQKEHLFYNNRVRSSKQYVVEIAISLKFTEKTQDNGASYTTGPVWSLLICSCHCLQWAWNQKCISFAIPSHFKIWYFVVKDIITKKIPNTTLSTFSTPLFLSWHQQRRGFVALIICDPCGCRGCTEAQALGSAAGVHSWPWTCASSEWLIDEEFSQEFSDGVMSWGTNADV